MSAPSTGGWSVTTSAPAKLTLTLRVLGTRPDGFHELEALTVGVTAPADTLVIERTSGPDVTLTLVGAGPDVPAGADNLVVRAARAVLPAGEGLHVELTKRIPSGAGLGGGSADAAALLRVLRDRYDLDPGAVTAAAAALGSDVPVCLHGRPVMMRGRGEVLDPVGIGTDLHVVIATPGFSVPTPAVFRAWDALGRCGDAEDGERSRRRRRARSRAGQRAGTRRRAGRAAARRVPAGAGEGDRSGADARGQRLVLLGPRRRRRARGRRGRARCASSSACRRSRVGWCGRYPGDGRSGAGQRPCCRRCQRVFFSSFLCFFFRMRLRRFLIREPMAARIVAVCAPAGHIRAIRREPANPGGYSRSMPFGGGVTAARGPLESQVEVRNLAPELAR